MLTLKIRNRKIIVKTLNRSILTWSKLQEDLSRPGLTCSAIITENSGLWKTIETVIVKVIEFEW